MGKVAGTKEVTVQEIIDAIAENGLDHLREQWVSTFGGKITGGCVLQQGAVNLGVVADYEALGEMPSTQAIEDIIASLSNIPSADHSTLVAALNRFKVPTTSKWYRREDNNLAGSVIVSLNDAFADPDGWDDEWDDDGIHYLLPTYAAVADMVKDILSPYKDEVVTLSTMDYTF